MNEEKIMNIQHTSCTHCTFNFNRANLCVYLFDIEFPLMENHDWTNFVFKIRLIEKYTKLLNENKIQNIATKPVCLFSNNMQTIFIQNLCLSVNV